MITTLFWDIDGVFVDTEKLHFEAWQWLANQFDQDFTEEEYEPMIGRGSDENMVDFCRLKDIQDEHSRLQEMRRAKYAELRERGIPVIEENVTLLKKFKAEYPDLKYIAVSSASRKYIEENLARALLSNFFHQTVSFEDREGMKRKPAPDIYLYACEVSGSRREECLAFEDSESGVRAARAAKIQVVKLPTDKEPKEIMKTYQGESRNVILDP